MGLDVLTLLSLGQYVKASVRDFPVMTELTRLTGTVYIVHEWGQDGWILAKFLKNAKNNKIVMIKNDNDDDDKGGKSF